MPVIPKTDRVYLIRQLAAAPAYVKGAIYFDTGLNKLPAGRPADTKTVTSA